MTRFALAIFAFTFSFIAHAADAPPATCLDRFRQVDDQFKRELPQLEQSIAASEGQMNWAMGLGAAAAPIMWPSVFVSAPIIVATGWSYKHGKNKLAYFEGNHVVLTAYEDALLKERSPETQKLLEAVGDQDGEVLAELVRRMHSGELCTANMSPKDLGRVVSDLRRPGAERTIY